MADSGKLVVLFRAKKDPVDKYDEVIREGGGYNTVYIPVLSFNSVDSGTSGLVKAIMSPHDYSGIIFTSQTAVGVLVETINKEKLGEVKGWSGVFVVGPATKECVSSDLGLQVTAGGVAGNADALSDIIINYVEKNSCHKPFLFPCGNIKRETLPKRLSERNIGVVPIVCYQTVQHPLMESAIEDMCQSWASGTVLVFFSPSGVQYALPCIKKHCRIPLEELIFVAIGPTTGEALVSNNVKAPLVALKPTPQDILALIKNS